MLTAHAEARIAGNSQYRTLSVEYGERLTRMKELQAESAVLSGAFLASSLPPPVPCRSFTHTPAPLRRGSQMAYPLRPLSSRTCPTIWKR
jgi:hypothetical protein